MDLVWSVLIVGTGCVPWVELPVQRRLLDFHEWCRVTRHQRVFHRLTGCQYTVFMYYFHILFSCYTFHITFSFMYCTCSYTFRVLYFVLSIYCFMYHSCTIFIYCFPIIHFILLSLSCTVLVHILFVYCTFYFSYIVFMYCFMYCSCTIFIYCFPFILFILLSLSCL